MLLRICSLVFFYLLFDSIEYNWNRVVPLHSNRVVPSLLNTYWINLQVLPFIGDSCTEIKQNICKSKWASITFVKEEKQFAFFTMHTSMAATETETATATPLFICKFHLHTVYPGKLAFFQINSNTGNCAGKYNIMKQSETMCRIMWYNSK